MTETLPPADKIKKAREELMVFKQENELKEEKSRDPHWEYIDLEQLREDEAEIWGLIQAAATPEEADRLLRKFNDYRARVVMELEKAKLEQPEVEIQKTHRGAMLAWLANRAQAKANLLYQRDDLDRR